MANVIEPFVVISRGLQGRISGCIGNLVFDDVDAAPRILKFGVKFVVQRAEANADAEIGLAAKCLDERKHNLARGDRVFARLDVDVGNALGAMIDQSLRELIMAGAEAGEVAIIAAHAAVGAIFAAEIGYLDDGADENAASELFDGNAGRAFVKRVLSGAPKPELLNGRQRVFRNHAAS